MISLYEEEYIIRLFVPYSNSLRDLAIWETLILLLSMLYPFVFIALSYLFLKPVNDNDIEFADMPGVMKAVLYHPYAETYPQLFQKEAEHRFNNKDVGEGEECDVDHGGDDGVV